VLDGRLYAVGGKDERGNKLKSVERYDPRSVPLLPTPASRLPLPYCRALVLICRVPLPPALCLPSEVCHPEKASAPLGWQSRAGVRRGYGRGAS
jgi:hypothetical protein